MSNPIKVKFDNNLPDVEVEKPLYPTSPEEGGSDASDVSEIKVTGTYTPLIKFNDKTIQWQDVLSMTLGCTGFTPTLSLTIIDHNNVIMMLDTPGPDNSVIVEILPKFDKIYKKIKLSFYVTNIRNNTYEKTINIEGIYNCKGLNDCNLESFGKISTYKFYEQIAQRLKLGLCSNIDDSGDERWIYMDSNTFLDSLQQELQYGGTSECILDGWIDLWNNINIVNLRDLYSGAPDKLDKIWVTSNLITFDTKVTDDPIEIDPIITNDFSRKVSSMYIDNYTTLSSNKSNSIFGTDRAINIFNIDNELNQSLLIQDGSGVKEDVFIKYYYNGEYIGEDNNGNYLYQQELIDSFKQKINNNVISVRLGQPCLGLMRGGKVNLEWYDDSDMNADVYHKGKEIKSNIDLVSNFIEDEDLDLDLPTAVILNRKISGQYYIKGTNIIYNRLEEEEGSTCRFEQEFILSRSVESFNYNDITKEEK